MPFKTSTKGWHANWFYVQNPEPALPGYSCLPPVYRDTWNSLPMGEEAAQALNLFCDLCFVTGALPDRDEVCHPLQMTDPVLVDGLIVFV